MPTVIRVAQSTVHAPRDLRSMVKKAGAVKICQGLLLESKNPKHYAFDFADFHRF